MTTPIQFSDSESSRFKLRVGRWASDGHLADDDVARLRDASGEYDVVICRYQSRQTELFASMMAFATHAPIYADSLLYWRTSIGAEKMPVTNPGVTVRHGHVDELESLVMPIFENYPSHYSANPLFHAQDILDGYLEWVTSMVSTGKGVCLVLETESDERAAFAIVTVEEIPDVKFGGISIASRGLGLYRNLIDEAKRFAGTLGRSELVISTQAHNVAVMSTWAAQGWKPFRSVTTVHLSRRDLLEATFGR